MVLQINFGLPESQRRHLLLRRGGQGVLLLDLDFELFEVKFEELHFGLFLQQLLLLLNLFLLLFYQLFIQFRGRRLLRLVITFLVVLLGIFLVVFVDLNRLIVFLFRFIDSLNCRF